MTASSTDALVASEELLIRCAPSVAFAAFREPGLITRFWLAATSGPLERGGRVRWTFMVPGASANVTVEQLVYNELIRIRWDDGSVMDLTFAQHSLGTLVAISQRGFKGERDEVVARALHATSGFALILAELKVLLEHGETANIVRDKAALLAARELDLRAADRTGPEQGELLDRRPL